MKKQLLFLVLFMGLFSAANQAQDKKMFAGVDLGFSSPTGSSSFSFSPSLGYWMADNMALVGGITFSSSTPDKVAHPDQKNSDFGIGAELRYGWHHGDHTFFFMAPGVSYLSSKAEDTGVSASTSTLNIRLSPGVDYMMGDRWSISSEIGLINFVSVTPPVGSAVTDFRIDTKMSDIKFALWYHF